MRLVAFLLACLLTLPANAQQTGSYNSGISPKPVVEGGTGAASGGTAMDNIAAPSGNGIQERTGSATYQQDSIPLVQAKGGTHTTSLATGQVILGGDPPTGVVEVDGDRIQGVTGAWVAASRTGSSPGFPSIITSFSTSCTTGSPCTWTRGANTRAVLVRGCGAGGAGQIGATARGGGGGGPGFCNPYWYFLTAAQAGSSQTLSVGTGGQTNGTAGGATCFGAGATCGGTKASTNIFYWGGGTGGQAAASAFPGSPYETGTSAGSDTTGGSVDDSVAGRSGTFGGANGAGTTPNSAVYGANGGGGGGEGTGTNTGAPGAWGANCSAKQAGGTGATTGTAGNATGGSLSISGVFAPGCSGGGGGGATSGTGGNGGDAQGFAAGGGGGGGASSGTQGNGGKGGAGFVLIVELQ